MRFVERDRVAPPKWFATENARHNRFMLVDYFGMDEKSLSQTRSFEPVDFSNSDDPYRSEVANPEEQMRAGMGVRDRTYSLPAKVEISNYKSLEKIEVTLPEPPKDRARGGGWIQTS